ncbi:MAG: M23 family metallopeptidase [Anaerolineaceae bacterium]|nr:M23 family metallopeptidase [Anaerolineaceae bacterium]
MNDFQEPPVDPLEDTNPSLVMRPVQEPPRQGSAFGWVIMLFALLLTAAAVVVLLLPNDSNSIPDVANLPTQANEPTLAPTDAIPTTEAQPTVEEQPTDEVMQLQTDSNVIPTISAERISALLQAPFNREAGPLPQYDPFTTIPQRPRTEFIDYTVVQGDTVFDIAQRYNLAEESIAWCNGKLTFNIRPGDVLRIPPMDGACYRVLGTRNQTVADVADEYNVSDPYDIIDFPGNNLYGQSPEFVLQSGFDLFLPGGEGPLITWDPGSTIEENSDGTYTVSFAHGQAGSCGAVQAAGGTYWGNPLPNGTWVRGFFSGHTGLDLSASVGTPIYAANGGPVLFSGTSNWGYGITVVLGHGPFSTLYGHMSQRNVSCGQVVSTGQVVGLVGSTGNSSGPHLHFEIRYNDVPQDPTLTAGIGW